MLLGVQDCSSSKVGPSGVPESVTALEGYCDHEVQVLREGARGREVGRILCKRTPPILGHSGSKKVAPKTAPKIEPHFRRFRRSQKGSSIRAAVSGVSDGGLKTVLSSGVQKTRFCNYLLHFSSVR